MVIFGHALVSSAGQNVDKQLRCGFRAFVHFLKKYIDYFAKAGLRYFCAEKRARVLRPETKQGGQTT